LAAYVAGWLAISGVAAALGLLAVRTISPDTTPPRRTGPFAAVRDRCVLTRDAGAQRPPVTGPPSAGARPGVYRSSPPPQDLVGALRRGVVVVQYRPGLTAQAVVTLRTAFDLALQPTIVTPDATSMPYAVAGTAWGRLLGCRRFDGAVLAALRRFARRYGGQGPDSRP
jgi:Protein of unknown function (DUF3105)